MIAHRQNIWLCKEKKAIVRAVHIHGLNAYIRYNNIIYNVFQCSEGDWYTR